MTDVRMYPPHDCREMLTTHYHNQDDATYSRCGVCGRITEFQWKEEAPSAAQRVAALELAIDRARRETASAPENRWCRNATIILNAALQPTPPTGGKNVMGVNVDELTDKDRLDAWLRWAIYKPFGTYNECRVCHQTWWDPPGLFSRERHRYDCLVPGR